MLTIDLPTGGEHSNNTVYEPVSLTNGNVVVVGKNQIQTQNHSLATSFLSYKLNLATATAESRHELTPPATQPKKAFTRSVVYPDLLDGEKEVIFSIDLGEEADLLTHFFNEETKELEAFTVTLDKFHSGERVMGIVSC